MFSSIKIWPIVIFLILSGIIIGIGLFLGIEWIINHIQISIIK